MKFAGIISIFTLLTSTLAHAWKQVNESLSIVSMYCLNQIETTRKRVCFVIRILTGGKAMIKYLLIFGMGFSYSINSNATDGDLLNLAFETIKANSALTAIVGSLRNPSLSYSGCELKEESVSVQPYEGQFASEHSKLIQATLKCRLPKDDAGRLDPKSNRLCPYNIVIKMYVRYEGNKLWNDLIESLNFEDVFCTSLGNG